MSTQSPTLKHGLTVFGLSMVVIVFIGSFAQSTWGIYGLAVTQILIALCALLAIWYFKVKPQDVFPLKVPKFRHIIGSLFIWFGAYLSVMVISLLTLYFFPEGMTEVSQYMGDFFASAPLPVALLVVAVMPGICEEMLHRGFIQYTMRYFSYWQIVLGMGLIFGVFHLDSYRFLPTAILGAALTIILLETRNILLPMFIHFVNNALTVVISSQNQVTSVEVPVLSSSDQLLAIGAFTILLSLVPWLGLWGLKILRGPSYKIFTGKRLVLIGMVSLALVVTGSSLITFTQQTLQPIFLTNFSMSVDKDTTAHRLPIEVDVLKNYQYSLELSTEKGLIHCYIVDSEGVVVFEKTAGTLTMNGILQLSPGLYELVVDFVFDQPLEGFSKINFMMEIK